MNRTEIAGELVRVAKELTAVHQGEVYNLDLRKAISDAKSWAIPQWRNLVKRLYRQSDGLVMVEKVRGDVADVYNAVNPAARMLGSIQVPVSALKNASVRSEDMNNEQVARELVKIAKDIVGRGFKMTRDFYAPRGVKPYTPHGTDLAIYEYEKDGLLYAAAFVGKQSKPIWHYRFKDKSQRTRMIDKSIEDRKRALKHKADRRKERKEFKHDLKVGDILSGSWGYDQTNVEFYQVIGTTEKSVVIREIASRVVKSTPPQDYVVPVEGKFTGPKMTKRVGPGGLVKIKSYLTVSKWNGKPKYETSFGFGH